MRLRTFSAALLVPALTLGLAAEASAAETTTSAPTSVQTSTPTTVLPKANTKATAAAHASIVKGLHQKSVVETAYINGNALKLNVSDHAGIDKGLEVVRGTKGVAAELRYVNNTVYLKATTTAWTRLFGAPASLAGFLSNKWVRFTPTDRPYQQLSSGVSLQDVLTQALPSPATSTSTTTFAHTKATKVSGLIHSLSGALYIGQSSKLPLGVTLGSKLVHETVSFSHWGQPVVIPVPKGSQTLNQIVKKAQAPTKKK